MRLIWVLVGSLAIVAGTSARGAEICPPYAKPINLAFETQPAHAEYNNTLNVTGIRNLFQERGTLIAGPHVQALGVTFITPLFRLDARTRYEARGGGYCVYLEDVHAEFGFRSMEVYVTSEYPPGSCEYRAILDHENQHVSINTQGLREFGPRVRQVLEGLLALEKPLHTADAHAGTQRILAALTSGMNSTLDDFERRLSERNAVIDTASNYNATSAICTNWNRGNVWPQSPQVPKNGLPPRDSRRP